MGELDLKIYRTEAHLKEFIKGVPKIFVGNGYTYISLCVKNNYGRELIAPQPTYRKIQIIDNENIFIIEKDVENNCFNQQHYQISKDGEFILVNSFPIEVKYGINDPDVIIRHENIKTKIVEIETKKGVVFYDLMAKKAIEGIKSGESKDATTKLKRHIKMYQFPQVS